MIGVWIAICSVIALFALYNVQCWFPHKARARKSKKRILCIGDSITFGAGVVYTRWKDAYPRILGRMCGKAVQVLNYGVSGATVSEGTDHPYPPDFREAAQRTLPDVCVFMLGTNDSKPHNWDADRCEAALIAWVREIKAYGSHPKVLLLVPPAAFSVNGQPVAFSIREQIIRDSIRPILQRIAEEQHVALLDLYEMTKDHPEWFSDGVHPNTTGNRAIAKAVDDAIRNMII